MEGIAARTQKATPTTSTTAHQSLKTPELDTWAKFKRGTMNFEDRVVQSFGASLVLHHQDLEDVRSRTLCRRHRWMIRACLGTHADSYWANAKSDFEIVWNDVKLWDQKVLLDPSLIEH
uniref:Uncharacterized protein n=1 Tax=Craspedostauros australis TaxID=1486917 RepID=A0A7R9WQ38_9STRA|mmetsp:Transcript_13003/g.35875  ORF Transcript_13003/g.35875 Transcript_13003/m.35875 type:complete len:119 (+) Transcript_13003:407-763(+)|eukprot:CAMPEP_0198124916 /NCGR_PEP_ID=MMETSP1442-20131203/41290_1 /TAXON_ID= /ORGANISM="Craspedostauros australis, Strain CCMP3328" /LENGTH=118 /DNA_ID=CAMNT_0043784423 /DNA_START=390 /DNA_END=746 /DNA_ORIENTATION=-